MGQIPTFRRTVVAIGCVIAAVLPVRSGRSTLVAAERIASRGVCPTIDIALDDRQTLHGTLVAPDHGPLADRPIALLVPGAEPVTVRTDSEGRFAFRLLRGGSYVLASGDSAMICRAWVSGTAPPVAAREAQMVVDRLVVRGQQPLREVFVAHPFLLGTIIAAAIAIPIAVHNGGGEPATGS